jgi:hypothetical protein
MDVDQQTKNTVGWDREKTPSTELEVALIC